MYFVILIDAHKANENIATVNTKNPGAYIAKAIIANKKANI